ncbi:AraC family transcriptional regulator [Sphingomonas paeninsulae]|jgi:AraC family transcriptional regulator|uniref:AraC family transcriptional regulator n=1 Tax=Sphingomonas paeninsulae TaxID=2319844 RepID=A0A494TCA5_SPHPE|nr:AraC family transcriptional regulator [Sphingomonas paeninsulae]AYJ87099.1 AraC family transcriptional regulator [Sphingomonas paeninsulae]
MGNAMANAELRTARARVHVYTYRFETPSHHTRSPGPDVLALISSNAPGGEGFYRSASTTSRMVPLGGLMIVPSDTSISAMGPGGERRLAVCTMADGILPKGFDRNDQRHLAMCADIRDANVRSAMQRMAAEVTRPGFGSDVLIDGLAAVLQVDLARYFDLTNRRETGHRGTLAPWQLRRIEDFVHAADGGPLRIADLAALVDVSPGHLARTFKQSTGRTVHKFVEEARLARARVLLGQTRVPLKQVADQLGFSSPSSFSLAFRRATGTTPGRFRSEATTIN